MKNEDLYEKIDSSILLSLLSYCGRSPQHIEEVIRILGSQIIEFTRKCSRLLLLHLKPIEKPKGDGKYRLKGKEEEKLAEL